jgi:hypothetical protein
VHAVVRQHPGSSYKGRYVALSHLQIFLCMTTCAVSNLWLGNIGPASCTPPVTSGHDQLCAGQLACCFVVALANDWPNTLITAIQFARFIQCMQRSACLSCMCMVAAC